MRYKLGIDVGGTCVDLVLLNETTGQLAFGKQPRTPDGVFADLHTGVSALLTGQQLNPAAITTLVHGTSLVADGIQQHLGGPAGLLVSRGQEDLPETGREAREDRYDINSPAPAPLVARSLRRGITGTIDAFGTVTTPLAEAEASKAIDYLVGRGVSALAVSLDNAFANPVHETWVGAYIRRHYPQLPVSLSTDLTTDVRPYERLTATLLNAYTQPLTTRYLSELRHHLTEMGLTAPLYLITSAGHLITTDAACQTPIDLLESGPVGCALLSARLGQQMQRPNLLSFDMGGTSAQLSLLASGVPQWTSEFEVARVRRFKRGTGLPVAAPGVDLTEIGAGAASLAYVDAAGKLQVGPDSAAPDVGPACFGRGGTHPTVTDADLLLGYISESFFRGQTLSRGAARRALLEHIALPLEIGVEEAARAIHRLANETMANAALVHLFEKGCDPRQFALLASGGAGPIHGFGVARLLGTTDVIVPAGAGITATLGLLLAPLVSQRRETHHGALATLDYEYVNALLARLEETCRADLAGTGVDTTAYKLSRSVTLRVAGRPLGRPLPLPSGPVLPSLITHWQAEVGNLTDGTPPGASDPVVSLGWQVTLSEVLLPLPERPVTGSGRGRGDFPGLKGYRQVVFIEDSFPISCPIYDGSRIWPGDCLSGPAIIEEAETTVVVGPKAYIRMDAHRNLTITLR